MNMDIYIALTISTIVLGVLGGIFCILFVFWFYLEKRLAKYGESKLYSVKRKR